MGWIVDILDIMGGGSQDAVNLVKATNRTNRLAGSENTSHVAFLSAKIEDQCQCREGDQHSQYARRLDGE